jgi:photosystem II stability/assembly factor-like uncharacterized protein
MVEVAVATGAGVYRFDAGAGWSDDVEQELSGQDVGAIARDDRGWWGIAGDRAVVLSLDPGRWEVVTHVPGTGGTCLHPAPGGLLVGTPGAHLLRLSAGRLEPVRTFEQIEGRDEWYTPWGGPPDTRSVSVSPEGFLYVNVHVGGVVRSTDEGRTWRPTIDIHTDVHQVLAHPAEPGLVFAAAAVGLAVTEDGGDSWRCETEGLHASYARAVAISDDVVLLSVSRGPGGHQAAIYRRTLKGDTFERCTKGLPEWFSSNIDTACLAASGPMAAFGTEDGSVFLSDDCGQTWRLLVRGLPGVRSVAFA